MPAAYVIDDLDAGYAESGSGWDTSGLGGYGGRSRYHPAGTGMNAATWTFAGLMPGLYQIEATWAAHANRASDADYRLWNGAVPGLAPVNQKVAPAGRLIGGRPFQWLGLVTVRSGTLTVTLTDAADGVVSADAVSVTRAALTAEEQADVLATALRDAVLTAAMDAGDFDTHELKGYPMSPATRLDQLLRAEGIPISGVSINPAAGTIRIDYTAEATADQRTAGNLIAARLDLRARRSRKLGDINAAVAALPLSEVLRFLTRRAAEEIQSNPYSALDMGIPIPGDEVDPNPPPVEPPV